MPSSLCTNGREQHVRMHRCALEKKKNGASGMARGKHWHP